ncbi:MAG: hypothetical protein AAFX87_24605 [Bacteroidota bacterium]
MINLLLSILTNVAIFAAFRTYAVFKIDTFRAIVINYVVCVLTGLAFIGDTSKLASISLNDKWLPYAIVLGAIFIGTFYLMALTTQKFSITVSSIASKMSLIIPVLFSLLVLKLQTKAYDYVNYIGLVLGFIAILLSSYRKSRDRSERVLKPIDFILPIVIFLFGGVIDTVINYVNVKHLMDDDQAIFPVVLFASAAVWGIIALFFRKGRLDMKSLLGGVLLGMVNYFSVYFVLKALSSFGNDGAMVFPILNIGIILVSSLLSILLFKEKLLKVNWLGLILALIAIIFISYQDIIWH